MKHTLQKIAMILAICLFMVTGCQKDDDNVTTEQSVSNGTTITKISFEEFKKSSKAFSEFEKLQGSKEGFNPKSREYGDGYYYETEEVTLIEYSDERYSYKSYIFPMYRETPTSNIENLLIWEKSTGETNSYILTYYLSESDIESILTGKPIYLGNKTLIVPVQKSAHDPYVVQTADGICGVYSGLEPDYGDYFTMNVEGTTVYFDVVDCSQYVVDFSLMQGSNNGGSNGGGGSSTGGDDGWSIGVVYFPLIPGSGDGGGPVTDPDGSGGYYIYNPVKHTPIVDVFYQQFYSRLDDINQRLFLITNKEFRNKIKGIINVFGPYQEEAFTRAEKIVDLAVAGYEEEAMSMLDFLTDEHPNTVEDLQNINELLEITNAEILTEDFDPDIFNMAMEALKGDYLAQPFDTEYYNAIDPYTTEDLQAYWPGWDAYFTAQCAFIRFQHPEYSTLKVYWEASKEMIHIALDVIGLIPVVGEVADLANGVIYTIEGEGVDAALSFASMIPVAGWASAGVKFAKRSDGLIFTVKNSDNAIDFGTRTSKKFRQLCGLSLGDPRQAHHIISRASSITLHPVVQRATQAGISEGFHIDSALNGIAVAAWRNQPNHNAYNNRIISKLEDFIQLNPNATPTQCYNKLMEVIQSAKAAIINNPNTHLNNLIF